MKIFNKIFALGVVALAATSCMYKAQYKTVPFVTFNTSASLKVEETVGVINLPIQSYNTTSDVTVTVTGIGTAEEGVNYEIVGASTLTLKPGEPSTVQVKIIDIDSYTGDKVVTLRLTPSDSSVEVGAAGACRITIADKDFNYTWTWFSGEWQAQDYEGSETDGDPYTVKISKTSDDEFVINGIYGCPVDLKGTVNFAGKGASIGIGYLLSYGTYGDFYFLPAGDGETVPVEFTPEAITIGPYAVENASGAYFTDNEYTVLTRKK